MFGQFHLLNIHDNNMSLSRWSITWPSHQPDVNRWHVVPELECGVFPPLRINEKKNKSNFNRRIFYFGLITKCLIKQHPALSMWSIANLKYCRNVSGEHDKKIPWLCHAHHCFRFPLVNLQILTLGNVTQLCKSYTEFFQTSHNKSLDLEVVFVIGAHILRVTMTSNFLHLYRIAL